MAIELGSGNGYAATGLWLGDDLAAVSSWIPWAVRDDAWFSAILAVDLRHRQQGYALRLKLQLLEAAEAAPGIGAVVSKVRVDNSPMLRLNRFLKAEIAVDQEAGYCWCVISV